MESGIILLTFGSCISVSHETDAKRGSVQGRKAVGFFYCGSNERENRKTQAHSKNFPLHKVLLEWFASLQFSLVFPKQSGGFLLPV